MSLLTYPADAVAKTICRCSRTVITVHRTGGHLCCSLLATFEVVYEQSPTRLLPSPDSKELNPHFWPLIGQKLDALPLDCIVVG